MTATTDATLLLRAVRVNPADDGPRHALADCWQESDDPVKRERGEYIRYGLAYEHHASLDDDGGSVGEWWRETGVWPYLEWPDSMHSIFGHSKTRLVSTNQSITWFWRRGFIESVTLPLSEAFTRTGKVRAQMKRLFEWHPVTEVVLSDREPGDPTYRQTYGWWLVSGNSLSRYRWHIPRQLEMSECEYPTRDLALSALSRAVVSVCRRAVNLPEVPDHE